jgi:hypothetical protein
VVNRGGLSFKYGKYVGLVQLCQVGWREEVVELEERVYHPSALGATSRALIVHNQLTIVESAQEFEVFTKRFATVKYDEVLFCAIELNSACNTKVVASVLKSVEGK